MDATPVNNSFLVTMAAEFDRGRVVINRCFSIFATPIMSPGIQDSSIWRPKINHWSSSTRHFPQMLSRWTFFWFSFFFFYLFELITPFNLSAPFSILSFLCWRASYVCLSVSISTEYSTGSSRQFRVTCVVFSCITSFYFAVKVIDTQSHLSAKKLKRQEIAHRFMCRFEGVISFFVWFELVTKTSFLYQFLFVTGNSWYQQLLSLIIRVIRS